MISGESYDAQPDMLWQVPARRGQRRVKGAYKTARERVHVKFDLA
jgi:hypothetical protein